MTANPDDPNKYIAPDPRPYIDRERQERKARIKGRALWLIRQGHMKELLELMENEGFTESEIEVAKKSLIAIRKLPPSGHS